MQTSDASKRVFCYDQYEQQMAGVNSVTHTHADGGS